MKRKEMIEFAQTIVIRLYDLGFISNVQEAISTNSIYIHTIQTPDMVRVSDHGVNNGQVKFNFLPTQKNKSTFKNGNYYYSMTEEGIEDFLFDFKLACPIVKKEEVKAIQEIIAAKDNVKKYIIKHKHTNTYFIENSNSFGKTMGTKLYDCRNSVTEEEYPFIYKNFRINLQSAQVFMGEPNITKIMKEHNVNDYNIDNYLILEVSCRSKGQSLITL